MQENKIIYTLEDATFKWLKLLGNKVSLAVISTELVSNNSYPSLICLTDLLDDGNFIYDAVRTDISYIDKFVFPLLAHIVIDTDN
jgi:hypothetical protein